MFETQLQSDGSTVVTTTNNWTYDNLNRLTTDSYSTDATGGGTYTNSYTYDLNSNRINEFHTVPGGSGNEITTNFYTPDDQVTSTYSTISGWTTNTYDANGSLTESQANTVTNHYTYDARNKMVTFAVGTTTEATYVYDESGNRVAAKPPAARRIII